MKYDREGWEKRVEGRRLEFLKQRQALEKTLDEDGYPTDGALKLIETWHFTYTKEWFEFIESMWHLRLWGWSSEETINDYNEPITRYRISTAGWSGNESIIEAMQTNHFLWHDTWVQSRRGGHFIFELKHG